MYKTKDEANEGAGRGCKNKKSETSFYCIFRLFLAEKLVSGNSRVDKIPDVIGIIHTYLQVLVSAELLQKFYRICKFIFFL